MGGGWDVNYGGNDARHALPHESLAAGEHLVQDRAEREDVAARIGLLAFQLLRGHVPDGAEDSSLLGQVFGAGGHQGGAQGGVGTLAELRQTEVEKLGSGLGEHDVARLQVAVQDAMAMGLGQRVGDVDGVAQGLREGKRARREPLREALALQVLHDQEVDAILLANVIEGADVGVIQGRDGAGLALEALAGLGVIGGLRGENLDGHGAVQAGVPGPVHFPHATRPQRGDDGVRPKARVGGERHEADSIPQSNAAGQHRQRPTFSEQIRMRSRADEVQVVAVDFVDQ